MSVGWPAGLFGLGVLLLPIAIHLLQRGAGKRVPVASIRFFTVDEQPSWRRLQLTEYGLLALRLALFALLVALLARVTLRDAPAELRPPSDSAWVVRGVDASLAASLAPEGAALRWLSPGFPAVGGLDPGDELPEWGLLAHLSRTARGAAVRVIGPARPATLGPRRPGMRPQPVWVDAPAESPPAPRTIARDVVLIGAAPGGALAAAVRGAVGMWRDAGLPFGDVRAVTDADAYRSAARDGDWVVAAADAPGAAIDAPDAVAAIVADRPVVVPHWRRADDVVAADAELSFAAALYFDLVRPRAGPPPGYRVAPDVALPAAGGETGSAAPPRTDARVASTMPRWLLVAIAVLWTVERALSARARRVDA